MAGADCRAEKIAWNGGRICQESWKPHTLSHSQECQTIGPEEHIGPLSLSSLRNSAVGIVHLREESCDIKLTTIYGMGYTELEVENLWEGGHRHWRALMRTVTGQSD
uniref:Uncharacterized protein n=1 Tax=Oryza glumipatula TaxID=40148 RepID=A0A0D9ZLM6_9ORYZ